MLSHTEMVTIKSRSIAGIILTVKWSDKNLPYYHFVSYKSQVNWPDTEPRLPKESKRISQVMARSKVIPVHAFKLKGSRTKYVGPHCAVFSIILSHLSSYRHFSLSLHFSECILCFSSYLISITSEGFYPVSIKIFSYDTTKELTSERIKIVTRKKTSSWYSCNCAGT